MIKILSVNKENEEKIKEILCPTPLNTKWKNAGKPNFEWVKETQFPKNRR